MDMEKKLCVELKGLDDEGAGLARIATLGVIDFEGDLTKKGAFGEQHVQVLPSHSWGSVPLGKARVFEKGNEALAEFQLNLDTIVGREWHAALRFDLSKGQPVQEWSYGFSVLEATFEERSEGRIRILEKLKVHEVSPVVVGAGVDTGTIAIKAAMPFEAQLDAMITEVGVIMSRAKEIEVLRKVQGRSLSPARVSQLVDLQDQLKALVRFYREEDEKAVADIREAGNLLAQFERIRSGLAIGS